MTNTQAMRRPDDVSADTDPGQVRQEVPPHQRRKTDLMRWLLVRVTGNNRPQVICKPTRNQNTILGEALLAERKGIPREEIMVKPILQDGHIDLDTFCASEEFSVGLRPIFTRDDSKENIAGRLVPYPRITPRAPEPPKEELGPDGKPKWLTQGVYPRTEEY